MYNAYKPRADELPSSKQLVKSTVIAAGAAAAILVTVVMPAEYGVDPTGAGRLIGLTEMGEIKSQLAEEAEKDRLMTLPNPDGQSSLLNDVLGLLVGTAHAQEKNAWTDEISFTLEPGEGIEWKLVMEEGATADYAWEADGGVVNYDLHGDGGRQVDQLRAGSWPVVGRGQHHGRLHRQPRLVLAQPRRPARHRDRPAPRRLRGDQAHRLKGPRPFGELASPLGSAIADRARMCGRGPAGR